MKLSLVILTWNSATYIEKCLTTVKKDLAESNIDFEIIFIDNGSTDGTVEAIKSAGPNNVVRIELGNNTGTTFSRNIGLRYCTGTHVAIIDSDVIIKEERTFERLIEYLDAHQEVGILVPRLIFASGRFQKSTDVFPTLVHKLKRFFFLRQMEEKEIEHTEPTDVDYAISAFWLFRKTLTAEIGLLDEHIFYAPEDLDYCLRSWVYGRPVRLYPQVTVIHDAKEITRKKLLSRHTFSHAAGLFYFFRKHGYMFSATRLRNRIAANMGRA